MLGASSDPCHRTHAKRRLSEIQIGALSGFGLEGTVVEKRSANEDEGGDGERWWC
jgi:hypothetical protein